MYQERLKKIYHRMREDGIALLMLSDSESRRDPAIRYLTGQPSDALLFLNENEKSLLIPWDMGLAAQRATANTVLPYADFKLEPVNALLAAVEHFSLGSGTSPQSIEIPDTTPHPLYQKYTEKLNTKGTFNLVCRENGIPEFIRNCRAQKDEAEIALTRKACAITDTLIAVIETAVLNGTLKTESDAALFIEAECRKRGCEGTSFATLAAGTGRSFAIHAFPGYTDAPFAGPGLSILDFGVVYEGYASDVTMTFACGHLSAAQEKQISLVLDAYKLTLDMLNERDWSLGALSARIPALAVDDFFKSAGYSMPHGLGHGTGLEIHEKPFLRSRESNKDVLLPGMIFTVEPGLYLPETGGIRYENDILLTAAGAEPLTHSKIVRM
ncbi:MAG: Xaa-Pro peptidase family protein [Spirochaetaceae bacterium]|jgi:Xaa-Pro dipeptidase|nr:Xaa-Pro peptidase family protein [Spirochaetaceae bacterium]